MSTDAGPTIARLTAHESPFADLPVAVNDEPLPAALIEAWVNPLYFGLDQAHIADFVARQLPRADDALIDRLLADTGWRSRVAAAYLVALRRRHDFIARIGTLLLRSDVCYAGAAYCVALAECGSPRAVEYLDRYLDYYLSRADLDFDQGPAMAALSYLDRAHGTARQARHLEAWRKFAMDRASRNLPRCEANFARIMTLLRAFAPEQRGHS